MKRVLIVGACNWEFAQETRVNDIQFFLDNMEGVTFDYMSTNSKFNNPHDKKIKEMITGLGGNFYPVGLCFQTNKITINTFRDMLEMFKYSFYTEHYDAIFLFNPIMQNNGTFYGYGAYHMYCALDANFNTDKTIGDYFNWTKFSSPFCMALVYDMLFHYQDVPVHRFVHDPNEEPLFEIPNEQFYYTDVEGLHYMNYDTHHNGKYRGLTKSDDCHYTQIQFKQCNVWKWGNIFKNDTLVSHAKKKSLTFGFSAMENDPDAPRIQLAERLKEIHDPENGINIYIDSFPLGIHNKIPYDQYQNELRESMFTFIIDSYNEHAFSHRRVWEAIANGCVPIVLCGDSFRKHEPEFYEMLNDNGLVLEIGDISKEKIYELIEEYKHSYDQIILHLTLTNTWKEAKDENYYLSMAEELNNNI